MSQPRVYTKEEVEELLLKRVREIVKYWSELPEHTTNSRLTGVAFSILTFLDGEDPHICGFSLTPCPHPADQAYREIHGQNWFPDNIHIGGTLHEDFYNEEMRTLKAKI